MPLFSTPATPRGERRRRRALRRHRAPRPCPPLEAWAPWRRSRTLGGR